MCLVKLMSVLASLFGCFGRVVNYSWIGIVQKQCMYGFIVQLSSK